MRRYKIEPVNLRKRILTFALALMVAFASTFPAGMMATEILSETIDAGYFLEESNVVEIDEELLVEVETEEEEEITSEAEGDAEDYEEAGEDYEEKTEDISDEVELDEIEETEEIEISAFSGRLPSIVDFSTERGEFYVAAGETVRIIEGGEINGALTVQPGGRLYVDEYGYVWDLILYRSATAIISGYVETIFARDNSEIELREGAHVATVSLEVSHLTITGGEVGRVASHSSEIIFNRGAVQEIILFASSFTMNGGILTEDLFINTNNTVMINGGELIGASNGVTIGYHFFEGEYDYEGENTTGNTLIVNDGEIHGGIWIYSESYVEINGGIIHHWIYIVDYYGAGSEVVINNGLVLAGINVAREGYLIINDGEFRYSGMSVMGEVIINGGFFYNYHINIGGDRHWRETEEGEWEEFALRGKVTLNDGELTGVDWNSAIDVITGHIVMNGGIIHGNTSFRDGRRNKAVS